MRKYLAALSILALVACNDNKKQETDALNRILKVHDSLMALDDRLLHNKAVLDSLLKLKTTPVTDTPAMHQLSIGLGHAEDVMDNWMHQFEPDQSKKPHDEVMKYLDDQQKQINQVDMQMSAVLKASDEYLKQYLHK